MLHALDVLGDLRDGQTLTEMHDKLLEIVGAVRDTGKAGSLQLTLKVKPASKGRDEIKVLMIEDTLKATIPQHDRAASIFYTNHENELQREDPRQVQMFGLKDLQPESVVNLKEVK